ncbi:hypothetical protein [Heliorestis convoluta]|uniref:Uncharacterized protein n=1 Tax=Heliorestis convoluta TaxID=356322 RepID=A0A5Q2N8B4_9FIRM|nr:hypothetical protein [Heliorestis convoluta]QGG48490.1 hypothetical protein FTV88_2392 [Heliorestis convoluta]
MKSIPKIALTATEKNSKMKPIENDYQQSQAKQINLFNLLTIHSRIRKGGRRKAIKKKITRDMIGSKAKHQGECNKVKHNKNICPQKTMKMEN